MRVPKRPFVFYSEIRNFTVVLKRSFVFHSEIQNLKLHHSFFDYEIRNFSKYEVIPKRSLAFPSRHTTSFQRLYDVYTTSATSYRRRIDVETTSCVYWVCLQTEKSKVASKLPFVFSTTKYKIRSRT